MRPGHEVVGVIQGHENNQQSAEAVESPNPPLDLAQIALSF
jgi:hypothetical protein